MFKKNPDCEKKKWVVEEVCPAVINSQTQKEQTQAG